MTEKLYRLNYDDILFFDIETCRGEEIFNKDSLQYKEWAWTQRNKETNVIPKEKKIISSYLKKAALFPEFGKIVCISVGYIHNENIMVRAITGEEKDILKEFIILVNKTGRKLCNHNAIQFDLPYIRKRFFINGLSEYLTKQQGNDAGCKSWHLEDNVIDTMDIWRGTGFANTGLSTLAMVFGIPAKEQLNGSQVSDYYYKGKINELADYCNSDVACVANLIRRWRGDSILPVVVKEEVIKPIPLLERILANGKINKEDIEQLQKVAATLTDEEKPLAQEIVQIALGSSRKKLDKEVVKLFTPQTT